MTRSRVHRFFDRMIEAVRDVPPATLAELAEGTRAQLTGVVRGGERDFLMSPLTGRPCVYYRVSFAPRLHGAREQGVVTWTVPASAHRAVPFVIEQDAARAVIDPAFARFSAGVDHEEGSTEVLSPRHRAVLDALGKRFRATDLALVFREAVIEPGETVTLVGSGTREPDPVITTEQTYRDGATRLRIIGSEHDPLIIRSLGKLA